MWAVAARAPSVYGTHLLGSGNAVLTLEACLGQARNAQEVAAFISVPRQQICSRKKRSAIKNLGNFLSQLHTNARAVPSGGRRAKVALASSDLCGAACEREHGVCIRVPSS